MSEVSAEVDELRKKTISLLSSVLTAKAKIGIPIHLLCYEYEETVFEKLKFREMGYGTLQQFISDYSYVFTTSRGPDGHVYVKAIPTDETKHIHRLVSGQKKKTKKKAKKIVFPVRRVPRPTNGRPPPSFITNRSTFQFGKPTINPAFRHRPTHIQTTLPPRFQNFTRRIANPMPNVKHNTASNLKKYNSAPPPPPIQQQIVLSKVSPRPNTSTPVTPTTPQSILPIASDIQKLEKNLRKLLQDKPNGIFATRLRPEYSKHYGEELPENVKEIIQKSFSDFIDIQSPMANQEILYFKQSVPKTPNAPLPSPGMTPIADERQQNITQLSLSNITTPPTAAASSTFIQKPTSPKIIKEQSSKLSPVSPMLHIDSLVLPDVGDQINVYVCHIESLDRFFIQLQDSTINDLVHDMQEYYDALPLHQNQMTRPKIGDLCCSRFSQDKLWFRAKILSVKEQRIMSNASYRCHVFYPDYGNDEYVLSTELKLLSEEFCELPFQAIQCCLNNLISAEDNGWSESTTQYFQKITEDVELIMKVIDNNGNLLSVDLTDANGQSICKHLVEEGHAQERIPSSPPPSNQVPSNNSRVSLSRTLSLEPNDAPIKGTWIKIPDDEYIDLCVTHIVSSCVVHAKLVGQEYHEKLEILEKAINNSFENASVRPAAQLDVGQYYIAMYDDEWRRAQLTSIKSDGDCEIMLVDSGIKTLVSKDDIKNIQPKFLRLPFQAFYCTLKDVPESNDPEILQYMTEILLGKANLGLVYDRENTDSIGKVTIGIYDEFSDGTEINTLLREKIEAEKKLVPKLPKVGEQPCHGFVTHVTEDGEFYIQVFGPGLDRLETLTKDISSHFSQGSRAAEIIAHPEIGQICCAKCPQSSNWYRAQVKQVFQQQRLVEVEFIDYGNRETINMVLIRKPTAVSESVITLPFQAVKVKLDGTKQLALNEENMYEKLKEFVYTMDGVYVKINVVAEENQTPVTRISIPTGENESESNCIDFLESFHQYLTVGELVDNGDGLLTEKNNNGTTNLDNDTMNTTFENISMYNRTLDQGNTTLSEWEVISNGNSPEKSTIDAGKQQQLSDIKEEEQRSSSGISTSSSTSLRSPRLATPAVTFSQHWGLPELKISEQFVSGIVQDATNPSKFTVMPYDQWDSLEKMYKEMTEFYNNNVGSHYCDVSSVSVGDVCVVYHQTHEIWYRAVIHANVDDKMVVKFPDFSSLPEMVSCSNIRILADQFKRLPFLSIRCTLFGIEPIASSTWSKDVCDFFHSLVVNETFQVEIVSDAGDGKTPIQVTLHGNENGKHFIVNNILVQQGYAQRKQIL